MGKKSKSTKEAAAAAEVVANENAGGGLSFLAGGATIDTGLASLFDMSVSGGVTL